MENVPGRQPKGKWFLRNKPDQRKCIIRLRVGIESSDGVISCNTMQKKRSHDCYYFVGYVEALLIQPVTLLSSVFVPKGCESLTERQD